MKTEDREKMGELYVEGFGLSPEHQQMQKFGSVLHDNAKLAAISEGMEQILEGIVQKYEYLTSIIEEFPEDMNAKNELLRFYMKLRKVAMEVMQDAPSKNDMPSGLPATEFEQEEGMY